MWEEFSSMPLFPLTTLISFSFPNQDTLMASPLTPLPLVPLLTLNWSSSLMLRVILRLPKVEVWQWPSSCRPQRASRVARTYSSKYKQCSTLETLHRNKDMFCCCNTWLRLWNVGFFHGKCTTAWELLVWKLSHTECSGHSNTNRTVRK